MYCFEISENFVVKTFNLMHFLRVLQTSVILGAYLSKIHAIMVKLTAQATGLDWVMILTATAAFTADRSNCFGPVIVQCRIYFPDHSRHPVCGSNWIMSNWCRIRWAHQEESERQYLESTITAFSTFCFIHSLIGLGFLQWSFRSICFLNLVLATWQ